MKQVHQKQMNSAGQTLIETLAAVFILAMGMTASVGLAIYALNSSGGVVKQIIATGLAREGLEAVRNMRDTNWLKDAISVNGCYNFSTSQANAANCYPAWLNKTFCLDPANSATNACNGSAAGNAYFLGFDSNVLPPANFWYLTKEPTNYALTFNDPNVSNTWKTGGFYSPNGSGISCLSGTSDYCRKIIITKNPQGNVAPYNQDVGPLLLVQSQVWWVDKKCPRAPDFASASISCRIEMDTYLTNWKNF